MKLAQAGLKPCPTLHSSAFTRRVAQPFSPAPFTRRVAQAFKPAGVIALIALSACAPKTKYVAPVVETPAAFRENGNWKTAEPSDTVLRGDWWTLFGDPQLDALEVQIDVSNETLKAAEAQFMQPRALVRGTRSPSSFRRSAPVPSIGAAQQSRTRAGRRRSITTPTRTSCCRYASPTKSMSGDGFTAP